MNTSMKKRVLALVATSLVAQSTASAVSVPGAQYFSETSAKVMTFLSGLWSNRSAMPKMSLPSMPARPTIESLKTSVESVQAKLPELRLPNKGDFTKENAGIATAVVVGTVVAYKGAQALNAKYQSYQDKKQGEVAVKGLELNDENTPKTVFGKNIDFTSLVGKGLRNGTVKLDKDGNLVDKAGEVIVKAKAVTEVKTEVITEAPKTATKKTSWFGFGATKAPVITTEVKVETAQPVDINATIANESAKFESARKATQEAVQLRLAQEKAEQLKVQQQEEAQRVKALQVAKLEGDLTKLNNDLSNVLGQVNNDRNHRRSVAAQKLVTEKQNEINTLKAS